MEWISVEEKLPEIKEMNSRVYLPLYVKMPNDQITIADYSKSKFKDGAEWVGNDYEAIWICRERGVNNSGIEINPTHWMPIPSV